MKNLKPSQLPEKTVIGNTGPHYEELYIKKTDGIWEDLFSGCGHCEDAVRVSDEGCDHNVIHSSYGCRNTVSYTSDIYFTDYKIIAVPYGYSLEEADIHGDFSARSMTYADGTKLHNCERINCEES